ncbi:MAG: hypothetical protein U1A77_09705 [Pirellulales bacterium]|jgi:hypothetical protein
MKKHHNHQKRSRRGDAPRSGRAEAPAPYVPKPPVTYGKPTMILEDASRQTFEFKGGAWTPFDRSIAECRQDCLVKEMPQKINSMTRYEVRFPLPAA